MQTRGRAFCWDAGVQGNPLGKTGEIVNRFIKCHYVKQPRQAELWKTWPAASAKIWEIVRNRLGCLEKTDVENDVDNVYNLL